MWNIKKLGLLLLIGLSCYSVQSYAGLKNKIDFSNDRTQQMLVEELKAAKVSYKIDRSGAIWYRVEDADKVDHIKRSVYSSFTSPAFRYKNEEDTEVFINELKKYGVAHRTRLVDRVYWVTWSTADDAKVRRIKEDLDRQFANRERQRINFEVQEALLSDTF